MQAYFGTAHGIARVDKTMWPYYCDANGVYLKRSQLAKPDIVPHILIRIETIEGLDDNSRRSSTFAVIIDPDDKMRIVDGIGREWYVSADIWEVKSYIDEHAPTFLDSLAVTCGNCRRIVGPPGPLARSGHDHYRHILCADCGPSH